MNRGAIQVGTATVEAGTRGYGFLHCGRLAAGTEVRIPFQVVHGRHDGPSLCLESTLQGWEPVGAEVLRRALLRVDPTALHGTIYCLPLANPLGVEFGGTIEGGGLRVNPADMLDLNRVWPGKRENGWLTERMASVLWNEVVRRCQYLVDYHDGTGSCDELPVAFPHAFPSGVASGTTTRAVPGADGIGAAELAEVEIASREAEAMNAKIRAMSIAFGAPVIWWREHPPNPATLCGACTLNGIVPLVVEVGGGNAVDANVGQGAECTLNILRHLGMIGGELVVPRRQIMVNHYVVYRAAAGGYYLGEPDIRLDARVRKGQLLGRIIDPVTSDVYEECRAPVNGIVISRRITLPVNPGGYIAHLADTDAIIWERTNV